MQITQNPVRSGHWASKRLPAFLAGVLPKTHYTPIYAGQKKVGQVVDGVFIKRVLASKHQLRKPPGYAFDISTLEQAEKAGANELKIIDIETGNIYRAAISTIWTKGFPRQSPCYEPQFGLELHHWSKGNEPTVNQLFLWSEQ